jgi:hypothetical protein
MSPWLWVMVVIAFAPTAFVVVVGMAMAWACGGIKAFLVVAAVVAAFAYVVVTDDTPSTCDVVDVDRYTTKCVPYP